jgi:hypothetical protein
MCSVKKIGEEETDKLERHGNHAIPYEGENGADRKSINVNLVR